MKRPLIPQEYRELYRAGYRTPEYEATIAWAHMKRDIDRALKPMVIRIDRLLARLLKLSRSSGINIAVNYLLNNLNEYESYIIRQQKYVKVPIGKLNIVRRKFRDAIKKENKQLKECIELIKKFRND